MVEIAYGAHRERADLAGQSVAQARDRYRPLFNIPERAKASVNGKRVEKNLEPETKLKDRDELSFRARRRLPLLLATLALGLGLTATIFVYTYTTASLSAGLTAASDDIATVDVTAKATPDWSSIVNIGDELPGRFTGAMPEGYLFAITPTVYYNGDLAVKVYLANAGEMEYAYQHFNMRLQLLDNHGNYANVGDSQAYGGTITGTNGITTTTDHHHFQLLTLDNGVATFELDYSACISGTGWYARPYQIYLAGGSFKTEPYHPLPWGQKASKNTMPVLYCEVTQK